jgi:hypothetical protein
MLCPPQLANLPCKLWPGHSSTQAAEQMLHEEYCTSMDAVQHKLPHQRIKQTVNSHDNTTETTARLPA